MPENHLELARQISALFAALPQVEAVALSGSRGSGPGSSDSASDIDLYVYTRGDISLDIRRGIVERSGGAVISNLGLQYWGPGDEWLHAPSGVEIDIVYFDAGWMEDQIGDVIDRHQASLGYTTCFWHTLRQSSVFYDPRGWFGGLQARCQCGYPEALRRNIIALNGPVLRGILPAYAHQIEKAARRFDLVSLNHRIAALLASYFDILFALNRQLHPGEKRLVETALRNCSLLPQNMEADLEAVLLTTRADIAGLPAGVNRLLDHLDPILEAEGFEPSRPGIIPR